MNKVIVRTPSGTYRIRKGWFFHSYFGYGQWRSKYGLDSMRIEDFSSLESAQRYYHNTDPTEEEVVYPYE